MSPVLAAAGPSAYWYLTRGTGTVALVLLTVTVALGVLDVERVSSPRWPRFAIDRVHRDASLLVLVLLVVHIITSVLDRFAPLRLVDAVVPFVSAYRPVWIGLGALSFDVLVTVVVTSVLRRHVGYRAWRVVHWVAYASWPLAVFHTLGTGSDAKSGWLIAVDVVCVAAVLAAVGSRAARAQRAPDGVRGGAYLVSLAVVAGLVLFAVVGPFAPHWARRAGTPVSVLRAAAVQRLAVPARAAGATTGATTGRVARASGAPAPVRATRDHIPVTFTDSLAGTVRQIPAPGGALVDLVLRCDGALTGILRVRLAGIPVDGGGLSLTGSQVALTAEGLTRALEGRVGSLNGQTFAAHLHNTAGSAVDVRADLNIDSASGTVTGTLVGDRAR